MPSRASCSTSGKWPNSFLPSYFLVAFSMENSQVHISRSRSGIRSTTARVPYTPQPEALSLLDLESSEHIQDNHQTEESPANPQDKKSKLPWWKTPSPWWWVHGIKLFKHLFTRLMLGYWSLCHSHLSQCQRRLHLVSRSTPLLHAAFIDLIFLERVFNSWAFLLFSRIQPTIESQLWLTIQALWTSDLMSLILTSLSQPMTLQQRSNVVLQIQSCKLRLQSWHLVRIKLHYFFIALLHVQDLCRRS